MGIFVASSRAAYVGFGGETQLSLTTSFTDDITIIDNEADNTFEVGDAISNQGAGGVGIYVGTYSDGGNDFVVVQAGNTYFLYSLGEPAFPDPLIFANIVAQTVVACFAAGTMIATPQGASAVETLKIGDAILNSDGMPIAVKWVGLHTVHKITAGAKMQPVRIRAGALGGGLPSADLIVTADHGMIVDRLVVNASALVNGTDIDFIPLSELPDTVTYYHVETEAHDVIVANGAPSETFVDAVGRSVFDNYQSYLEIYGADRLIPEMNRPRISSQRLVPGTIRDRLGIADQHVDFEGLAKADLAQTA